MVMMTQKIQGVRLALGLCTVEPQFHRTANNRYSLNQAVADCKEVAPTPTRRSSHSVTSQQKKHDLRKYVTKHHMSFPRATPTHDTKSMHHNQICCKTQVCRSILTKTMVRSAEDFFTIEKMAAQSMGNQKIERQKSLRCRIKCPSGTNTANRNIPLKDTTPQTQTTHFLAQNGPTDPGTG